jgi:hypothetical protein
MIFNLWINFKPRYIRIRITSQEQPSPHKNVGTKTAHQSEITKISDWTTNIVPPFFQT